MINARSIADPRLLVAFLVSLACSDASSPRKVPPPTDLHVLALETFDGSGQAVHPDAAITPVTWAPDQTQLFVTPYPNGDATKENPSLFTGRSFVDWRIPSGVMNPIARPAAGYLSDPDEVFNPETNELWLYYRAVTNENEILLIRGSGPSTWSPPTLVASGTNHTIVSPTVVRRGILGYLQCEDSRIMHDIGIALCQEHRWTALGVGRWARAGARRNTSICRYRLSRLALVRRSHRQHNALVFRRSISGRAL